MILFEVIQLTEVTTHTHKHTNTYTHTWGQKAYVAVDCVAEVSQVRVMKSCGAELFKPLALRLCRLTGWKAVQRLCLFVLKERRGQEVYPGLYSACRQESERLWDLCHSVLIRVQRGRWGVGMRWWYVGCPYSGLDGPTRAGKWCSYTEAWAVVVTCFCKNFGSTLTVQERDRSTVRIKGNHRNIIVVERMAKMREVTLGTGFINQCLMPSPSFTWLKRPRPPDCD